MPNWANRKWPTTLAQPSPRAYLINKTANIFCWLANLLCRRNFYWPMLFLIFFLGIFSVFQKYKKLPTLFVGKSIFYVGNKIQKCFFFKKTLKNKLPTKTEMDNIDFIDYPRLNILLLIVTSCHDSSSHVTSRNVTSRNFTFYDSPFIFQQ